MAAYEWLLHDLVTLIYNFSWLMFLTHKHYGQVTTTAGHIFELNVLLNVTISNSLWIIFVDLEAFPFGVIQELFDFGVLVAIAGSQIETLIFLKTLTVNTMMTNKAGLIIFAMNIFSYGLTVLNILGKSFKENVTNITPLFLTLPSPSVTKIQDKKMDLLESN